ncbi:MAG: hypothetical protein P4L28_04190 [Paludibacteraceae bacterium]|nr:hypothetical protein [Paludibacteraceae bacterium]
MTKEVFIALIQKDIRELDMIAQGLYETESPSPSIIKLASLKAHDVISNLQMLAEVNGISKEVQQIEIDAHHTPAKKPTKKAKPTKEITDEKKPEPIVDEKPIVKEINIETKHEIESQPAPIQEPILPKEPEVVVVAKEEIAPPTIVPEPQVAPVEAPKVEEKSPVVEEQKKEPEINIKKEEPILHEQQIEPAPKKEGNLFNALSNKQVTSLRKSISIGNRFMFQRELFGNDADKMNQAIDFIDTCTNLHETEKYISENFHWDSEKESVIEFMNLVNRKFVG